MNDLQPTPNTFDHLDFWNDTYVSYAKAEKIMMQCDSYNRIEALVTLADRMKRTVFFRLLGEWWSRCDNTGVFKYELEEYVFSNWQEYPQLMRKMMTRRELTAYDALPETVTIYRGCYKSNESGLSWTLSCEIAEKFPYFTRYWQKGQPLLITAEVDKKDIIALKLCRDESEIITTMARRNSTRRLGKRPLVI